jgi:hypothetical protein
MATVTGRGAVTTVGSGRPRIARPARLPITRYDLITAIQDIVGPEDDGLVVATVRHLLQSRRRTARETGSRRCPPLRWETGWSQSVTGAINVKSDVWKLDGYSRLVSYPTQKSPADWALVGWRSARGSTIPVAPGRHGELAHTPYP